MPRWQLATARVLTTAAGLLLVHTHANAATPLDTASVSPDVTVELSSTTFDDENVAVDNLLGVVVPASLGSLPDNADLTAYHLFDGV